MGSTAHEGRTINNGEDIKAEEIRSMLRREPAMRVVASERVISLQRLRCVGIQETSRSGWINPEVKVIDEPGCSEHNVRWAGHQQKY